MHIMLSELTEAMIVNGVVLATVLASDLGPARTIGRMRLLRPVIAAALMGVYRSPETGQPVSRAGAPYAIFWIVVIGARAGFSYGAGHWFEGPLVSWAVANQVSVAAITDGLIFMAIAMVLVRTIGLGVRASRLPAAELVPQDA
jgi:hypothetical protein